MSERGAPDDAGPSESAVTNPWKRIAMLSLLVSAVSGLGIGLILGLTRPAGERIQGPLGLLFIVLVTTTGILGIVTTVGDKCS